VPDRTECPRCHKIGFVRHEYVVRGDDTFVAYYCGACNYTWQVTAGAARANRPTPPPKRADKK
jgi:transposase-like protein